MGESEAEPVWRLRGIRGATTVDANTPDAIYVATEELLRELVVRNRIDGGDVASVWFTTTPRPQRRISRRRRPAQLPMDRMRPSCAGTR